MNPKIHAGLALRKAQTAQDDMSEDEWLNSSNTITRIGKVLYGNATLKRPMLTGHQQKEAERKQREEEADALNRQLQELAAAQALRDEAANHPLSQF